MNPSSSSLTAFNALDAAKFSVAPMMDWTDRHCRYFHRLISRHALLYTEMVTTGALLHGDAPRFLAYNGAEHPVALQLGGSEPQDLALAARMAQVAGYDEVNLNVGCPSPRVQKGAFGACLMAEPELVRDCVKAMLDATSIPVTVKCRIGIDDMDEDTSLLHFVEVVAQSGCNSFTVHARKAWLKGLSPKENRDIPPLNYQRVHALKAQMPALHVVLNGGLQSLDHGLENLGQLDGLMFGRAAYQDPVTTLRQVDARVFGVADTDDHASLEGRVALAHQMAAYVDAQVPLGVPVKSITRHMMGLFNGLPGARLWRRGLSENAAQASSGDILRNSADQLLASNLSRAA